MAKVDRNFISINVEIDSQPSKYHLQNSAKKQKFTIVMASNNKCSGRLQIKNNGNMKSLQNITKRANTISDSKQKKYYFLRKNNRSKSNHQQSSLTYRKCTNLITTSSKKGRQNSKSYRIHTIDHYQQDYKKDKKITEAKKNPHDNSLNDITNKKHHFIQKSKNNLRKRNLINQDLEDFTTALKGIRHKDQFTLNLKHRKYVKAKTQFEQNQFNDDKHFQNKDTPIQNIKQSQNKKIIGFKKTRAKNLSSIQQKKETIDLKQLKKQTKQIIDYTEQKQQHQNALCQKYQTKNKNKIFSNYVDFVNRRKKEGKINKFNRIFPQDRSLIVRETLAIAVNPPKQPKQQSIEKVQHQRSKQKLIHQTPIVKKQMQNIMLISRQEQDQIKRLQQNQFDCSSIALAANQSSFLSDDGKKEIIITSNFKEQELQKYKLIQNILTEMKQNSPKKKKRRQQPKMSFVFRSQLKQVFPDRFFN